MAGRGFGRRPFEQATIFRNGQFPQPDATVTKTEDSKNHDTSSSVTATSSMDVVLPTRPAYGKDGQPIVLWTNYFELKGIQPETWLYRYSIAIASKDGDISKSKKKRAIDLLLQTAPFSSVKIATDWSQTLVSAEKIKLQKDSVHTIVWYSVGGEPFLAPSANDTKQLKDSRAKNTYQLLAEELGTVSLSELVHNPNYSLKEEAVQALNIIMSHGPKSDSNIAAMSDNRFFPYRNHMQVEMTELGRGLQALRGYFSSVRTATSRILVNINVATSAFLKPEPLLDSMKNSNGERPPRNEYEHRKLSGLYSNVKVGTNYLPNNTDKGTGKSNENKPPTRRVIRTIKKLSPWGENSTTVKFSKTDADGNVTQLTIQEHFQQAYNIKLAMPKAPLVNCGTDKEPIWIPAELCFVIPGQLARRLLDASQATTMIEFAARRPHENATSITSNGLAVTNIFPCFNRENFHLSPFGIAVDPRMITVHGRVLVPPQLVYRAQNRCTPQNGAWNLDPARLGERPFRRTGQLHSWSVLLINLGGRNTIPGGVAGIHQHLTRFQQCLETYGMQPGPVQLPCIANLPEDIVEEDISSISQKLHQALQSAYRSRPAFLLVLLPNENALLYDSIRYLCDCKIGIPTVCCIGRKFSKVQGQQQYFANVAMKFNQKLGGVNHTVDLMTLAPMDLQTIVFGIDVTHPSPGSSPDAPSIAGVVASVDGVFSQYPASMRSQAGRKEMVTELEEMIVERLQLWSRRNSGRLPNKVFVYRDGVSESQYRTVLDIECLSFKKAFDRLYGTQKTHPRMTFIVVGKRHHTRFYPAKADYADMRTGNPKAGTVVDRGITGTCFDFFLVAHQGLQGTSRPAHYIVLKDENKLGADQMQAMTHNLCYTFARATRAVSLCPPAYYADLVCERGRSYLHHVLKSSNGVAGAQSWTKDVHPNLMETMYYI